uniref:Photosynthetic NDH subcomplex L 2 n=1 Tax=Kalanchoe fedtschenkoi TaxID=63787 RepID=A0A7N0TRD0_KALFE
MATTSFATPPTLRRHRRLSVSNSSSPAEHHSAPNRRSLLSTALVASAAVSLSNCPISLAEKWGVRSFLREKYFDPGLSPEDAAARIRQTAEGLRSLRHMLETMSWRYVIFYIRVKSSYLDKDLKTVMALLPEGRRKAYVITANQLVENMSQLDNYVRTPKVYESYLYYEKALKSIDEVVAFLA